MSASRAMRSAAGCRWMARRSACAATRSLARTWCSRDGRIVHADNETEPELLWALRGGSGNLAAVTALELELVAVPEIYAGALFWPIERAAEVLRAWRRWIDDVPETCGSLGRMLQLPDVPFLPEHLRGRSFVLVEVAFLGSAAEGDALIQPLRDLGPVTDTMGVMATQDLSVVNMDPEFPLPYAGEGLLLKDFTREAVDRLVAVLPVRRCSTSRSGSSAVRSLVGRPTTGCSTRSTSRSSLHVRAGAGCAGSGRRRSGGRGRARKPSVRGTAAGAT